MATPEPNSSLIRMEAVSKTFQTSSGAVTVLKDIHIRIPSGEFISIVGRSGSGKSTLLNMLTGIDHPSQGNVTIAGTQLHKLSESQLASWRGRNLGIVFQFFQLLPMLSLLENTMLPMDLCDRFAAAERPQRALDLLKRVGLQDFAQQLPAAVSGGQQQLAAVARALANDPPILVADEPTGNLDSRTAASVMDLFQELAGQGKTIVMVTHDQSLSRQTGRSLILSDGELIQPVLAKVFSKLSHSNLLKVQHLSQLIRLTPGETLPAQVAMFVIASGNLQIGKRTYSPGRLLMQPAQATNKYAFRAADGPTEVFSLDISGLRQLAESLQSTRGTP